MTAILLAVAVIVMAGLAYLLKLEKLKSRERFKRLQEANQLLSMENEDLRHSNAWETAQRLYHMQLAIPKMSKFAQDGYWPNGGEVRVDLQALITTDRKESVAERHTVYIEQVTGDALKEKLVEMAGKVHEQIDPLVVKLIKAEETK